jgi:hypothetical protein
VSGRKNENLTVSQRYLNQVKGNGEPKGHGAPPETGEPFMRPLWQCAPKGKVPGGKIFSLPLEGGAIIDCTNGAPP